MTKKEALLAKHAAMLKEVESLKAEIDSMPDEKVEPWYPHDGNMFYDFNLNGEPEGWMKNEKRSPVNYFIDIEECRRLLPLYRDFTKLVRTLLVTPKELRKEHDEYVYVEWDSHVERSTRYHSRSFEVGNYFSEDQENVAQVYADFQKQLLAIRPTAQ